MPWREHINALEQPFRDDTYLQSILRMAGVPEGCAQTEHIRRQFYVGTDILMAGEKSIDDRI